ncbi:MAG: hypothetical protein JO227_09380, partial [Acetobacteraceae bacterium]|nr:hypothetical protein [Acetobacteraceae bacterium]
FIKGIRKGIEQGEYVYQRGNLLFGQGDPAASIQIDEQAVVFTMAFAKERGIWPREVKPPPGGTGGTGIIPPGPGGGSNGGGVKPPVPPPPPVPPTPPVQPLHADGVLREALIRLWEQARARKLERLANVTIRVFDAADGFRLLSVVAGVRSAEEKKVTLSGEYETAAGSTLELEYTGTPQDAAPLKDFLDPQLRAAKDKNVEVRFDLGFAAGLPMAGASAEKLTEQLTRFATGAAYVEATATVAEPAVMEAAE